MVTEVGSFIERSLAVYQVRVIQVLESVAVLHPSLARDVLPSLTRAIKASETKRGVGVDKDLRWGSTELNRKNVR